MKKFRITVDGTEYIVEVEPLEEDTTRAAAPVKSAKPAQTKSEPVKRSAPAGGVTSPMPGTVLKVLVNQGDRVEAGQALIILEAMKMENKIPAPRAGVVKSVEVTSGQSVDTGQSLLTLD